MSLSERKTKSLLALKAQMEREHGIKKEEESVKDFYESRPWRELRYKAILKSKGICGACKESRGPYHADHIKPRSKYPELELDENNLQVLCADCNIGKGNWDETDWRKR